MTRIDISHGWDKIKGRPYRVAWTRVKSDDVWTGVIGAILTARFYANKQGWSDHLVHVCRESA